MTCSFSKDYSKTAIVSLENNFIIEYLPIATDNSVKVYLYGLYLCQNPNLDQGLSEIAKNLHLTEQQVLDAFSFWEELGLITLPSLSPLKVLYHPLNSFYSLKPRKFKAEKYTEFSKTIQGLISDRMISTNEYTEYFNIMETYSISPESMLMIIKYCIDKKGTSISYKYITKVAKDFGNRGIITLDAIEKELASYVSGTAILEKILKAMSIRRQPDIEDSALLKKWTLELNFEPENIIYAASKLKKGSINKLDEFLLELYSMKSFSKEEISEYMASKKAIFDLAIRINKALAIYVDVIDTVVDTYTKKWMSFGFSDDALLFIASKCFKMGKRSLQSMDELVETLRSRGFITLTGVNDYFEEEKKNNQFISQILSIIGISRQPINSDKEQVNTWHSWGFNNEMIIEAAKLSAGKSSPLAYINGILSNWKNNQVYNIDQITDKPNNENTQESYNREYQRRRALAVSRAQKNIEKAMDLKDFPDIYSRLNSIEKDLAFAEIANDKTLLSSLESERLSLIENANKLLAKLHIDLSDLTPKYACEKCSDTGYVGTKRCDCYDKKVD